MPPLIFPHWIWGGVEVESASGCTQDPAQPGVTPETLHPLQSLQSTTWKKSQWEWERLCLSFSQTEAVRRSSSHYRKKLSLLLRPFFIPCWSPDPVLTIHGGVPSGALRSFPVLLSFWEILVKNWAQSKQRGVHRTTAFYSSRRLWSKLSASSDCIKTQDCSSKER